MSNWLLSRSFKCEITLLIACGLLLSRSFASGSTSPVWSVAYDESTKGNTYTVTPIDETAQLTFRFTDDASRQPLSIFTTFRDKAALQSWSASDRASIMVAGNTPVVATDTERLSRLLTLLYWQASFSDPQYRKGTDQSQVPYSAVDIDEVNQLYYAPAGLPTELLVNASKKEGTWYQSALQQILTDQTDLQKQSSGDQQKSQEGLDAYSQGHDVLQSLADNMDRQAQTDPASARFLRNQAHYIRKLATDMQLIKDQDRFTLKVPASVLKKLPHSWFSSVKNPKTVQIGADKVLIVINLLTAFTQNLAVSADRAQQLKALLDYANANGVSLNSDFENQARSLITMAGNPPQIVLDTFLDTTVDWIKSNAAGTTPQALAALSSLLAKRFAESSPSLSASLSQIARSVTDRFALLFTADLAADLLTNTSGIYSGIKTAEFSYHCSEEFDKIYGAAKTNLSMEQPAAQSLTSWAMAAYFHERSIAAYHQNYADLLEGARLAKLLANLFTHGATDDDVSIHNTSAYHARLDSDRWAAPSVLADLLKRYRFEATSGQIPVTASNTRTILPLEINYNHDFADHSALTANGSASFITDAQNGTRTNAVLTNGPVQAGSVFSTRPVDVSRFRTQFVFRSSGDAPLADGITFTIQALGPKSIGGAGGSLGYGDEQGVTNLPDGIRRSVAVKFDLYDDMGEGDNSTGLVINGTYPGTPSIDLTNTGINLHSGDTFRVTMQYDGALLKVLIKDIKSGTAVAESYKVDIASMLGGPKGYVGFTGGTGSEYALQEIYSWVYTSVPAQDGVSAVNP